MKYIIFCLLFLHFITVLPLNISYAQQDDGETSGGGDPQKTSVVPFPNQVLLRDAINNLIISVKKTEFHSAFKEAFINELETLYKDKDKKFLYFPHATSLVPNRYEGDYDHPVSVGVYTKHFPGEPIYFTKRDPPYDKAELARAIAQEIPHHVLIGHLRYDEDFVNSLGESLAGGYTLEDAKISLEKSFGKKISVVSCRGKILKDDFSSGNRKVIVTAEVDLKFRFDLSKFEKYKAGSDDVYVYAATVEERIIKPGMDADHVIPIIHKNVLLKSLYDYNQYMVFGFNPSLGLDQKKTYSRDSVEDPSGWFFSGDDEGGAFNNKKGYDYTPYTASGYRYTAVSCRSELHWPTTSSSSETDRKKEEEAEETIDPFFEEITLLNRSSKPNHDTYIDDAARKRQLACGKMFTCGISSIINADILPEQNDTGV